MLCRKAETKTIYSAEINSARAVGNEWKRGMVMMSLFEG